MLQDGPVLAHAAVEIIVCFLASLVGCELVRRVAIRRALLDVVNERSLHTAPTPRLGGVAIVLTVLGAAVVEWTGGAARLHVLVPATAVLALVGLRDDLRPLPAAVRLVVQLGLAIGFVCIVGVPPLLVARGVALPLPAWLVGAALVVWIVAVLNIYNFMDGMDGLAGAQAIGAAGALGVLLVLAAPSSGLAGFAVAIGGASLGFLAHNAPPARMFMGDAGSTFLGMAFATLAILGMHEGVPITESALPLAPFLLDGTFTIFRRALKKERIWTAHRSHLYQRAVQTGLGHRDVLLVYVGWIGVSVLGSVLAGQSAALLALAWAVAIAGLCAVWLWVVRRERAGSSPAPARR